MCPFCERPLNSEVQSNVPLQACPTCGGIWFTRNNADTYLRVVAGRPGITPQPASFHLSGAPSRVCPSCLSDTLNSGSVRGADVWRCGTCSGVFITREVLIQLRAPFANQAEADLKAITGILEALLYLIP